MLFLCFQRYSKDTRQHTCTTGIKWVYFMTSFISLETSKWRKCLKITPVSLRLSPGILPWPLCVPFLLCLSLLLPTRTPLLHLLSSSDCNRHSIIWPRCLWPVRFEFFWVPEDGSPVHLRHVAHESQHAEGRPPVPVRTALSEWPPHKLQPTRVWIVSEISRLMNIFTWVFSLPPKMVFLTVELPVTASLSPAGSPPTPHRFVDQVYVCGPSSSARSLLREMDKRLRLTKR